MLQYLKIKKDLFNRLFSDYRNGYYLNLHYQTKVPFLKYFLSIH